MNVKLISAVIGSYLGALIITFLLSRFVNRMLKKKMPPRRVAVVAFIVVGLFAFLVGTLTMGDRIILDWLVFYLPCLLVALPGDEEVIGKGGRRPHCHS